LSYGEIWPTVGSCLTPFHDMALVCPETMSEHVDPHILGAAGITQRGRDLVMAL
jgi:hypothetical protein